MMACTVGDYMTAHTLVDDKVGDDMTARSLVDDKVVDDMVVDDKMVGMVRQHAHRQCK